MKEFDRQLQLIAGEDRVRFGEPMDRHTTFRIGGPADFYVMPSNAGILGAVINLCRESGMEYTILGNGSNLLVRDEGYRGVVIAMAHNRGQRPHISEAEDRSKKTAANGDDLCSISFGACSIQEQHIAAGSGMTLASIARRAMEAGLGGLEFAAGIPGTLGGAVVMNAGAYGPEMKDVLSRVTVLDRQGRIRTLNVQELKLGYRTSCILEKRYVVLSAELQLQPKDPKHILAEMEDLAFRRRQRQPLEYPSAGSTFKRPQGHYAGKLIQEAGLAGYQVGGAQVSEKHCGFVINRGNATCEDVLNLCRDIKHKVFDLYQVELELEVKVLG